MKETLTVRPSVLAALERGDRLVLAHIELLERGTDEDIWTDEVKRGALVRWNILKLRALFPAVEPTHQQRVAHAEGLLRQGKIKPWGVGLA